MEHFIIFNTLMLVSSFAKVPVQLLASPAAVLKVRVTDNHWTATVMQTATSLETAALMSLLTVFPQVYVYIYVITKMRKYWEKLHNTKCQVYCSKHMQLSYHFYTRHLEVGNQQLMHKVILGASVASLPGSAQLSITCSLARPGNKAIVLVYIRWVNTVAKAASLLLFSQFSLFTADCLRHTVQMAI